MQKPKLPLPFARALPLALLLFSLMDPRVAQAGNIFDFLFGREEPPRPALEAPRRLRPPVATPAHPPASFRFEHANRGESASPSGGFCVRTCDGYYFPLVRSKNTSPQQSCDYACPSAPMAVYEGASIEQSHSPSGQAYTKLPTAFHFRDRTTRQCSCNVPQTALADYQRILGTDPTLRRGDIVISENGVLAYGGGEGNAAFTPIDRASFVSNELRKRIRRIVDSSRRRTGAAPAPQAVAPEPVSAIPAPVSEPRVNN